MITSICPNPAVHEPDCDDTRYDDRGDCHGPAKPYTTTDYILGNRPGEQINMCGSHGRQAAQKGEVSNP